jgi:hypothetical protein
MAGFDYDIGKQASINVISNGGIVSTVQITEFMAKQKTVNLKSRPLNSPPVEKEIPDGWEFSFNMDRLGPVWDDYFARAEDDYWNNNPAAQLQINQTIKEKDGSISQFRFDVTSVKFDETGTFKQDDKVVQKVSGFASRRHQVL